jgi:hypothetical protein
MKPMETKINLLYIKVLCVLHIEQWLFTVRTISNKGVFDEYRPYSLLTLKLTVKTQHSNH